MCVPTCNDTSNLCNNTCVSHYDVNACGKSCTACPAAKIAHAHASCDLVQFSEEPVCQIDCDPYYAMQGGQCVAQQLTCYPDADGDGWGLKSGAPTVVTGMACPAGTAPIVAYDGTVTNGDCDDTNKDAHPYQTKSFTTSFGASKSFDYNCDGVTTKIPQLPGICASLPGVFASFCYDTDGSSNATCACNAQVSNVAAINCGTNVSATTCTYGGNGMCSSTGAPAPTSITVACN